MDMSWLSLSGEGSLLTVLPGLFVMALVREDLAVITGGLLIIEENLPVAPVVLTLFAAVWVGDMLLFGVGKLAVFNQRARRLLHNPRVEWVTDWLSGNTVTAMLVARIVPGLITPVYIGCGLSGVRISLFFFITVISNIAYNGLLVFFVVRFGENVVPTFGGWAWAALIVAVLTSTFLWSRRVRRRQPQTAHASRHSADRYRNRLSARFAGMPALTDLVSTIGAAERIPAKVFYAPLAANWLWLGLRHRSLSLPSIANPRIEVGGLWGESKRAYLDMIAGSSRRWVARYAALDRRPGDPADDLRRALAAARDAGIDFPLVVKPDIGWQGYGVRLIHTEEELADYIRAFPEGATFLLQELIDWQGEAGIFYSRMPGEAAGRVTAVTLRYFPHVVGDGVHSVRDLILAEERSAWKSRLHLGQSREHGGVHKDLLDQVPATGALVRLSFIGSIRVGGIYRDAPQVLTRELNDRFDAISRGMDNFYYGRFDIRFASIDRLARGEDFRIIEVNGAGSEAISAWDPSIRICKVYSRLRAQQRTMFQIGALNRDRGERPAGLWKLIAAAWRQTRLIGKYPPSS